MLQLTKNSGKYHSCLQCGSAETYELRITREDNNSGLTIDLCGDCLDKLSSIIQIRDTGNNDLIIATKKLEEGKAVIWLEYDDKLRMMRKFGIMYDDLYKICNLLILEDLDAYYVVKVRPSYEKHMTENFSVTSVKKIRASYQDYFLNESAKKQLTGSYLIVCTEEILRGGEK